MKFVSLFSGIGGLDLGLERAGHKCVLQVENDPYCQQVLARHWPDVPRIADVKDVTADDCKEADAIVGGFPCQPVSLAGRRQAQADPRWLWPEFARLISEVRPRHVIVENVPGLLTSGMGSVLGDLSALGYDAEWESIPAVAVGAPHLRYRVFIVAYAASVNGKRTIAEGTGRRRSEAQIGDGRSRSLANAEGQRRALRQAAPERQGRSSGSGHDVADTQRERGRGWDARRQDAADAWQPPRRSQFRHWDVEPDVGRVASRFSAGMDGDLDAHESCLAQARTAGIPQTNRLRVLREHIEAATAPPESPRCSFCGHPLSELPCAGACDPWYLGGRVEETENLRCLHEGVLGLLTHEGQDVQPPVPFGTGPPQRAQAMGSRTGRLRALGNAVVPQVAEYVGRMLREIE